MEFDEIIKKIEQFAIEKGVTSTKVISASDIFVEDWVRQKCQYGCGGYARYFTCPPYSPTTEETRKRIQGYNQAMLFEFLNFGSGIRLDIHELMYEMEREAFLNGFYKAFAYTAGPCRLCESCVASKIINPNEFSKKECKHPGKARPSMESCSIDVFKTARKAGYGIDVVKSREDSYNRFCLLMLD